MVLFVIMLAENIKLELANFDIMHALKLETYHANRDNSSIRVKQIYICVVNFLYRKK